MGSLELEWIDEADKVTLRAGDEVAFSDSLDHWRNAFLRLLNLTDEDARGWCESAAMRARAVLERSLFDLPYTNLVEILKASWTERRPTKSTDAQTLLDRMRIVDPSVDVVWATSLPHDETAGVVGSSAPAHGRLFDTERGDFFKSRPVVYEEEYFDGGVEGLGYGASHAQSDWRMEKAHRQVAQCRAIARFVSVPMPADATLLDIGSGVGFFRSAAQAAGWSTSGVEVSGYAAREAKSVFDLDTYVGRLEDFDAPTQYDLVTLWDCVEHVPEPVGFLQCARRHVKPGGLVMLRTPNIVAMEREVFGNDYHSFKLEHLHYFGDRSLSACARRAGMEPRVIVTEAHLLRGFGPGTVAEAAATMRGSDFFAVFQVPV